MEFIEKALSVTNQAQSLELETCNRTSFNVCSNSNRIGGRSEKSVSDLDKSSRLLLVSASVLTVLTALALLATFYDLCTRKRENKSRSELLKSFSLRKNLSNLFSLDQSGSKDAIHCLHGIRALSMFCIIFLHTYVFRILTPFRDEKYLNEWIKTDMASAISSLNMTVDSFFVMSATLSTKTMLKELDQERFNVFKTILQRYMRLTPSVLIMILLNNTLAYFLSEEAPAKFLDYSAIPCEKFWWSTLLHLQVYTNPGEMCMHTTWYISVDTQLTFLAPPLVYLLWKFGKKASFLPVALISLSSAYTFYICYDRQFIADELVMSTDIKGEFYRTVYLNTFARAPPFFIGIMLGYILHTSDRSKSVESKMARGLCFLQAFLVGTAPFGAKVLNLLVERSVLLNALLLALVRNVWGFGIAFIIFVCHFDGGGAVNTFLSNKFWMPIGKLGFALYLVHPVLQYNLTSSSEHPMNLETVHMVGHFLKDFGMTSVFALLLFVLVEEPFSAITKYLLRDDNRYHFPTIKTSSSENKIEDKLSRSVVEPK